MGRYTLQEKIVSARQHDGRAWTKLTTSFWYSTGGAPLPPGTSTVSLSEPSVDRLKKCMAILSPAIAEGEIVSINLCYRPVTSSGYPFVSPLPAVSNAWVCAGHGPWGITLAPGSGKVASEMILGKATRSADVSLLGLPKSR